MHDQQRPFGFGRTGIDLEARSPACCRPPSGSARPTRSPSSRSGTPARPSRWASARGYNNFTMLQLASATATLVSGGHGAYKPRLVREIEGRDRRAPPDGQRRCRRRRSSPSTSADHARADGVTQEGTSTAFAGAPHKTGGKTGTAQAVGIQANEKYNAAKMEGAQARPFALHGLRAGWRQADHRAGHGGRERRLRLGGLPRSRGVFDYLLLASTPARRHRATRRARRRRPSVAGVGRHRGAAAGHHRPAGGGRPARSQLPGLPGGAAMNAGPARRAHERGRFERPSIWQRLAPVFTGFDGRCWPSCCWPAAGW